MRLTLRLFLCLLAAFAGADSVCAQRVLSLDSCRALALSNNKQMHIARQQREAADNTAKAMRTKYLPRVDFAGGYELTSRQVSILSGEQKTALSSLGTAMGAQMGEGMSAMLTALAQQGAITPQQAQAFGAAAGGMGQQLAGTLDAMGQRVVDAFHTDTRNAFVLSVMASQPLYAGGAITAANRLAQIGQQAADNRAALGEQNTLYGVDNAYWLVVSLKHKQRLAANFLELVQKLHADVDKMIAEGVATRANGLTVSVRENEAQMTLTQVDNGLALARMQLCQLCGLPLDTDIALADEDADTPAEADSAAPVAAADADAAMTARPELRLLQNAVDAKAQQTRLTRADFLPKVLLTGGYMATNPNLFDGFHRRFGGVWNVGVVVQVPLWNWLEGVYKVRADKAQTAIARLQLGEAEEMCRLQISQCAFKATEADKRLQLATRNTEKAEENLRCANLGFREGVMQTTDVMEAQTAWLQARTQQIDAQIDVKLSQVSLNKALGTLR